MDEKRLLERVKAGDRLLPAEVQLVRTALLTERFGSLDPYTLLHILWKSGNPSDENVIMRYLRHPDEMLRRIALQALSDRWPSVDLFDKAVDLLNRDPSGMVRTAAASSVGEIGAAMPGLEARSASTLLDRFHLLMPAADVEWDACYDGLMNLLRVPYGARPTGQLTPSKVRADLIDAARRLAAGYGPPQN